MGKKEKIFKTFILFLLLLFGCSQKYVDAEGVSLDDKVIDSWEELDSKIIEQDKSGFSLGFRIWFVVVVDDSLSVIGCAKEGRNVLSLLGGFVGCLGGLGGCLYVLSGEIEENTIFPSEERINQGFLISGISCFTGFVMMVMGRERGYKVAKPIPNYIKKDTVCADSVSLYGEEVKVTINNTDFEEKYLTDEDGGIELKFDEIISEPAETDLVLNLIIQYEKRGDG